ncbi:hypothetical protein L211DRAFT_516006 [Terfezia boudieri ATCC MYA-4762]|uniref:Uncharacterized protein n=1 Tax=Terfezia boudieri ATCC MYA-4762 TaxID=1051890 RepID=A0A3N4LFP6_9PEZI|nr:hypothetical protein L211DRAFT_516006 [Terfezia boudieri ATCC MYA-4762]
MVPRAKCHQNDKVPHPKTRLNAHVLKALFIIKRRHATKAQSQASERTLVEVPPENEEMANKERTMNEHDNDETADSVPDHALTTITGLRSKGHASEFLRYFSGLKETWESPTKQNTKKKKKKKPSPLSASSARGP